MVIELRGREKGGAESDSSDKKEKLNEVSEKTEKERERERGRDRNPEKARMFWDKPIHSGLVSLSRASDSTKVFCLAECGLGHHG